MPTVFKIFAAALLIAAAPLAAAPAMADNQGVIVIANDLPITSYDITQKINLLKILGSPADGSRKQILQSLIDDVVKLEEAERLKVSPSDGEVDIQIAKIAKSMKLDRAGLLSRLKDKGVATEFFRRYIDAQMGFNRVISMQNGDKIKVTPAEVDAKMAEIKANVGSQMNKIMADPRMKGITVFTLALIDLPVENSDPGLLQARAVDAQQVIRQFKGCGNIRAAGAGVFNVKFAKTVEADGEKLPPELKAALLRAGSGHAVGPVRGKDGLQVIGFCGTRKITPPKPNFQMPTRDQIETSLLNQKYGAVENNFLKDARKRVYIEYRDMSYAN
jgi:peptidyl-prolyl cis-trans isomerase SurA